MPPASPRRDSQDSYSALPPARRAEASSSAMAPARRASEESYSALPPARRGAQDSYSAPPAATRSGGGRRRRPEDSYSALPAVETTDVAVTRIEDTYVQDGRRASHRAEDMAPAEFGRPKERHVDQDLSSLRLVPALSSMEDPIDMPPTRMPKHGRPEDYGVPSSRPGPQDSYDRMEPAARAAGGRRRARA